MKKSDIWFYSGTALISTGCALMHIGLWLILLSIICFIAAYNNFKKENPEEEKEKDIYKDLYIMQQKLDFLNNKMSYFVQDLKKHKETTAAPKMHYDEEDGCWVLDDCIRAQDILTLGIGTDVYLNYKLKKNEAKDISIRKDDGR